MARIDLGGAAFVACAALAIGSAGVVAFARSLARSAVGLVGAIVGVAGLFAQLAADAPAAIELVAAGGCTVVLFLFAGAATTPEGEMAESNAPGRRRAPVYASVVVVAAFSAVAIDTVWSSSAAQPAPVGGAAPLGHALLGTQLLPFELAAFVVLATTLSAAAIARRGVKREAEAEQ
jgi:NADH:ubiquinone oxidoreductase subunit 6 (subunit J)